VVDYNDFLCYLPQQVSSLVVYYIITPHRTAIPALKEPRVYETVINDARAQTNLHVRMPTEGC
jgi:hypothetical protein